MHHGISVIVKKKLLEKKKGKRKKSTLYNYMKPDLNKQVEQQCDSLQRKFDVSFLSSLCCCFTEAQEKQKVERQLICWSVCLTNMGDKKWVSELILEWRGGGRKAKQQLPQTTNKDERDLNPDKTSVMRKHLLIHFRNMVLTHSAHVDTHQTK